jgi:putative ABC transport system ATP-binding protein
VDITVARGEFVAITGPSGSGKTTLLHCLAGLTTPDAGRIVFDGAELHALDDDARTDVRAHRMGFVFQSLNLIPALTVAENVELPLVLQGRDVDTIRSNRTRRLEQVGLADRDVARPADLSGGEQLRVAIARALVTDPDIIWADEPTGALDSGSARDVVSLLRAAAGAGATVVIVTHDDEVAAAADRRVHLIDGRVADGHAAGGQTAPTLSM